MFALDPHLLAHARAVLHGRANLRWLIGGACSGKSTIARALSARTGIPVYDMDEAVFGRYRFDPVRHPATTAWFTAADPLGWMLGLPWEEFDALYRAANAEMLDLLASDLLVADLRGRPDEPLILDGGITHPSVLVEAIEPARIICLEAPGAFRIHEWETAPGRAEMKQSVLTLPDGAAMWRRFLDYDRRMTETLGRESREARIRVFAWNEKLGVEQLADSVLVNLDL